MTQSSSSVSIGGNVAASHVNNLVADVAELYDVAEMTVGYNCPLTFPSDAPLVMDLCVKASAYTIGSFVADGYLIRPDGTPWDTTLGGHTGGTTDGTWNNTTVNQVGVNKAFLMPDHGACTVTDISGKLLVAVRGGDFGDDAVLDKIDILLIKVASDGTETTLDTTSITPTATASGSSSNPGLTLIEPVFSDSYGAGYSIGATERLGVRIKVCGHVSSSGTNATCSLNCDHSEEYYNGGALRKFVHVARFSRIAFTFA